MTVKVLVPKLIKSEASGEAGRDWRMTDAAAREAPREDGLDVENKVVSTETSG